MTTARTPPAEEDHVIQLKTPEQPLNGPCGQTRTQPVVKLWNNVAAQRERAVVDPVLQPLRDSSKKPVVRAHWRE